jgi:hypothetical protein
LRGKAAGSSEDSWKHEILGATPTDGQLASLACGALLPR